MLLKKWTLFTLKIQKASVEHLGLVLQYFYDSCKNSPPDMEMGTGFSCVRIVAERDPGRFPLFYLLPNANRIVDPSI